MKHQCPLFLLVLILSSALLAYAQSTSATISGIIIDPSSRVVPAADILILNDATGVAYSSATNHDGLYTVPGLPPGQYRVQVSKNGFKTILKPGVVLNVQSAVVLNFTLPIGATSETVTVEAGAPQVNTVDASVSTVIDRQFVGNIPLNGRSFQDLISMTPGITTETPQSGGGTGSVGATGDFSVNGQRSESNNYIVDGVSANVGAGNGYGVSGAATGGALAASTALGTTQSLVSVDGLEEFRVLSSTYSAEFGRSPGGQFTFQTRSGTEQVHGTGFDYLRNGALDANDWFNDRYGEAQPALRQNDFGGTIGGPIPIPALYGGTRRTFGFFSYEGLRLTQPEAASVALVPDTYLREQAPSAIKPILDAFPLPTSGAIDYGDASNPSLAQFLKAYSVPGAIDSSSVRLDHTLNSHLSFFARAAYAPSSNDTRELSAVSQARFTTQTYTFGATGQIDQKTTNELRIGFSKSSAHVLQYLDDFGGALPVDLTTFTGSVRSADANPYMYLYFAGAGTAELSTGITNNGLRQLNIVDTTALLVGHHALKAGIDYRRINSNYHYSSPQITSIFMSASDLLNNAATETEVYDSAKAAPIYNEFAAFIQDEWRIKPSLALSLGLRWEVDPPPTGANGQDAYTISGNVSDPSSLALAPRGTALWKTPWFNVAPRLGVAWQARQKPGWETVLRTGGGVFFDTDNQVASDPFSGAGFSVATYYYGVPLPLTPDQTNISISDNPPYGTIFALPQRLQLPYTLEWNASVEQSLGKAQTLSLSYVASNGRRQLRQNGYSLAASNPDFTWLYYYTSGITSSYNSLQTKFQRSLSQGVQVLASYTWSHAIDYGSTYEVLYVQRGNADFDVRHTFSAAVTWSLPSVKEHRLLASVVNHWNLDGRIVARTGFPVSLMGNSKIDPGTGRRYYTGLNLVPNTPVYLYDHQFPGGRAVNVAAFSTPSGASFGNAPRNFVRGFGDSQVNLAARREFPLIDRVSLQFRAEAFNILNHPNFGYIDPLLADATFGQATKTLNQSLGTVAPQYQQGGPRSMQFALKILF